MAASMSGQQFLTAVATLFFVTHRLAVPLLYRPYGSCNGSSINSSLTTLVWSAVWHCLTCLSALFCAFPLR